MKLTFTGSFTTSIYIAEWNKDRCGNYENNDHHNDKDDNYENNDFEDNRLHSYKILYQNGQEQGKFY